MLLSGCASVNPAAGPAGKATLDRAREQGFMRIGFANEAPFGYADPSGKLTGEAPEVARRVLKDLGVNEIDGVLTEFGSLIPGLQAGRFDLIAAGMFIRPQRCQQILFSEPDYIATEALTVKKGNPLGLNDYTDVAKNATARLGVESGAVEGDYARKLGVPEDRIVQFNDGPSGIAGLQAGRVDAFSLTSISLRDLLSKATDPNLELAKPFTPVVDGKPQYGAGGYGIRKGDEAFRDAFNEKLAALKKSGELLKIIEPFGYTQAELVPDDVTTAKLCAEG
jgi:polar amino acid transport system substrate-binding protein